MNSTSLRDFRVVLLAQVFVFSALAAARGADGPPAPQWVTPAVNAPHLQQRTFESTAAKTKISYHVYTPEAYDTDKEKRFPVLYWLHGSGGGLPGVAPLTTHFDAAMHAGKIPPMLIVFANGLTNSMWCDSKDGTVPMETTVVKELVPLIDNSFRTIPSRQGRLVEGFSMGGYGAARLGLKYHEVFGAFSMMGSGPLQPELDVNNAPRFGNPKAAQRILETVWGDQPYFKAQSPWLLAEQNAEAVRSKTHIRQLVGELDDTLTMNRKFDAHLTELKIPHTFTVVPGVRHEAMATFQGLGESNWEFYRAVFGVAAK